ncbi:Uncharacterised protein [Streptococcus suis]|uniref:Uncharacterized protein n=1 Tax=Streptococcus suis TaxID=1307 RepID=A0A0Z9NRW7_STRSU|nr:hypothetical protein SSU10_00059 [Streptococcus suis]CYU06505.1 Uncharacterised protein [Streptococcus suis]CYU15084.1 Uncharacterised protein [Streptococcus suis]CYU21481.1 Uncharacterised protein [Streptococcus suis]CYU30349.1 Uncharacterised protein [Streptococcus suis]
MKQLFKKNKRITIDLGIIKYTYRRGRHTL